jgi:hypothetical protein
MNRTLLFFSLMGALLGTSVRFPTFAILSLISVGLYGAFDLATTPVEMVVYHLVAALVALQVGYFVSVAVRIAAEYRKPRD